MRTITIALLPFILLVPLACSDSGNDSGADDTSKTDEDDDSAERPKGEESGDAAVSADEEPAEGDDKPDSVPDGGATVSEEGATPGDGTETAGDDDEATLDETGDTLVASTPELVELCDDLVAFKRDKFTELGCSSDDSALIRRLCAVSGSCQEQLQDQLACWQALDASSWSCDTGDGQAQTNGGCADQSDVYFGCLQTAIREEDPFGCTAAAEARQVAAEAHSCKTDPTVESTCNQLYLRDICTAEWEGFVGCLDGLGESDFECSGAEQNALVPKAGECEAEWADFDSCLSAASGVAPGTPPNTPEPTVPAPDGGMSEVPETPDSDTAVAGTSPAGPVTLVRSYLVNPATRAVQVELFSQDVACDYDASGACPEGFEQLQRLTFAVYPATPDAPAIDIGTYDYGTGDPDYAIEIYLSDCDPETSDLMLQTGPASITLTTISETEVAGELSVTLQARDSSSTLYTLEGSFSTSSCMMQGQ